MYVLLATLVVFCNLVHLAAAEPSPALVNRDGSLVLADKGSKNTVSSKDSLSVLLSREVEVFIFKNKARVWPYGQVLKTRPAYSHRLPNPQVESLIHKYAGQYGVDPSLVRAVIRHESGFNNQAVSPKGAMGLMQLMPGTADLMGVKNPFDPEQNIAGGVGYLRYCLDRFGNNVPLAVAAYNAGPERVAKTGTVPPIPETQTFVHNVVGTYQGLTQPRGAAPPAKGAHIITPGPAAKRLAAQPVLMSAANKPSDPEKVRRPKPKVIEVRFPKGKKAAD